MELNSLVFIFLFLPAFIISFHLANNKKLVIGLFGTLYYMLSDIKFLWLFLLIMLVTYLSATKVKNNKILYISYLVAVSLLLALFKYGNMLLGMLNKSDLLQFIMPIGISYYLFEAISYVSDVYRGKYNAANIVDVYLYLSFFPTILTGPIIRFDAFKSWLYQSNRINFDNISDGLRRFILGISKRVLIANQINHIVSYCYDSTTHLTLPMAWVGLLAYALRLYYDFSGCSDMSIGIACSIGYTIPENFNQPYTSRSISEFFRRWHISLGSWFKDYVYIPLGGNRVSEFRSIVNIMIVWIVTGLWHGSSVNYLIWGLYLGLAIIVEKKIISKFSIPDLIKWLYTILAVLFSWLIFSTGTFRNLLHYGKVMVLGDITFSSYFFAYVTLIVIGIVFILPMTKNVFNVLRKKCSFVYDLLLLFLMIASIYLIVSGSLTTSMYATF